MRRLEFTLLLCLLAACAACAAGGGDRAAARPSGSRLTPDGRMHLGLAQGYLESNQVKKAQERLKLAMASDPNAAEVHAVAAMIHDRNGEPGKAARSFDRALQIAPDDGAILNAHASWLCESGQPAQADQEFQRALRDKRYRTPLQALANAGRCAHGASQWARAESYLRRALEISPEDPQVLLMLAEAELRQGKAMEARAFIQRRDSLGADAKTLALAANIEDAIGDRHAAARYRQRLKEQFPEHAPTGEGARSP